MCQGNQDGIQRHEMVCTTRIASIGSASEASSHSFSPINAIAKLNNDRLYVTQHAIPHAQRRGKSPSLTDRCSESRQQTGHRRRSAVQKQCQPKLRNNFPHRQADSNQRDSFNQHQRGDHAAHIRLFKRRRDFLVIRNTVAWWSVSPDSAPPDRQSAASTPNQRCTGHRHFRRIGEAITFQSTIYSS